MPILIWLLFALFSAAINQNKNRSVVGGFLLGFFFGPLGFLLCCFRSTLEPKHKVNNADEVFVDPKTTFYISDNMGGFDGYLVDHPKTPRVLPPGWYRVRDLGGNTIRWHCFNSSPICSY